MNSWLHLTGRALSGCPQIIELLPQTPLSVSYPAAALLFYRWRVREKQDASDDYIDMTPAGQEGPTREHYQPYAPTLSCSLPLLTQTPIQMQAGWPLFTCSTPLLWIGKACLVFSQPPWPPVRPLMPNFLEWLDQRNVILRLWVEVKEGYCGSLYLPRATAQIQSSVYLLTGLRG